MTPTADFHPVTAARRILRQARTAALATLTEAGAPFASLVTVATDTVGRPLLLLSALAVHTANLGRDARASLLFEARQPGDPLQGSRVTVSGTMERLAEDADARRRFLARQPEAEGYAGFRDFAFWRMRVESAHLVAGFGRIVAIPAADLLLAEDAATAVAEAEPRLLAEAPQAEIDAITTLMAARFGGDPAGWRLVGLDPAGLDLGHGTDDGLALHRLDFAATLKDVSELPVKMKEIASLTVIT